MTSPRLFLFLSVFGAIHALYAQEDISFELEYTTEVQTYFDGKYNWVNLLSLSAGLPSEKISERWTKGNFQITLISVYRNKQRKGDDLMTFSNIDEENVRINPFMLGYTHQWEKVSLFGGVRNVNNDYFTMPYTSLFTNSSAGIFPTIANNFEMANYPLSAICLHFEYQPTPMWLFKSSLYNGVAHDPRENVFRSFVVNPRSDGFTSISELIFSQNKLGSGRYVLGINLTGNDQFLWTSWLEVEQALYRAGEKEIGCLFHARIAPQHALNCHCYCACGGYAANLTGQNDKLGVYMNWATFADVKERTVEITWQYPALKWLDVQPTLHYIVTGGQTSVIGLFRVIVNI